jgi:hypothetical protein
MCLVRTTATVAIFICICIFIISSAVCLSANAQNMDIDRSIKPGDDFYRYANGG